MTDEEPRGLRIGPGLVLPEDELAAEAVRSGGPGGQNVNKVATCIQLRFDLEGSQALSEAQKALLRQALGRRLTKAGEVLVESSRYREQGRNLEDARGRLAELLAAGLKQPRKRKPTRPTAGSKRRRLEAKRKRSDTKRRRSGPGDGEG